MLNAISSATSGIRQGMAMLDQAARNIALENVDGFQRGKVISREGNQGGVTTDVVTDPGGGILDDIVTTIIAKHTVKLNADVLRRADAVAGSLIDILG